MTNRQHADDRNSKRSSYNYRPNDLSKYYEKRLSQSSLPNTEVNNSVRSTRNKNYDSNKTLGSSHAGNINEGSFISSRITYDSEKEQDGNDSIVHESVNLERRIHPDYQFYASKPKSFTKKTSAESVTKVQDENQDSKEKLTGENVKVKELKEEEEDDPEKLAEISFSADVNAENGEESRNSVFKNSLDNDVVNNEETRIKEGCLENAMIPINTAEVNEKIKQLISLKKGHNKRNSMQIKINSKLNDLAESKRKSSRHQSFGGQKENPLPNNNNERLGITGFLEMKKKELRAKKIIQMREEEKAQTPAINLTQNCEKTEVCTETAAVSIDSLDMKAINQSKNQRCYHIPRKSVDLKGNKEGGLLSEFKRRNNSLIEQIALEKLTVGVMTPLDPNMFKKELKAGKSLQGSLEIVEAHSANSSENKLGTPTFFKHEEFFPCKEKLKITESLPRMEQSDQERVRESHQSEPAAIIAKRESLRSKQGGNSHENSVFDEEKFNELESLTQVSSHFCTDSIDMFKSNDSAIFVNNRQEQASKTQTEGDKEEFALKSKCNDDRSSFFDINGGEKEETVIKSQKYTNTRSSFFDINGEDSNEHEEEQKNLSIVSARVAREGLEDKEEEARLIFDKIMEEINVKNFLWIKTILKPHDIILNLCSALLYLFTDSSEEVGFLESKNWKKIQSLFVNPNEILKKMQKFSFYVEQDKIKEANIDRARGLIADLDKKFSEISDSKIYTEFASKIYEFLLASLHYYETVRARKRFDEERAKKNVIEHYNPAPEELHAKTARQTPSIFSKQSPVKPLSRVLETKKNAMHSTPQKVNQKSPKAPLSSSKPGPSNKGTKQKTPERERSNTPAEDDEEDIKIIKEMIKKSQSIFSSSKGTETEIKIDTRENQETPKKPGRPSPGRVSDKQSSKSNNENKKVNFETPSSWRKKATETEKITSPSRIKNYITGSADERKDYMVKHQTLMESEDLMVEEEEAQAWREMMEYKKEISRMLWDDERRIKRNREAEFLENLKREIDLYFEREKVYQECLKEKNKQEKEIWKILRKEFFDDLIYYKKIADEKEKLLLLDEFTRARKKKEIQDSIEEQYRLAKRNELKEREKDGQILKTIKLENEIQQKAAELEEKKQNKVIERQYRIIKAHNEKNYYKDKLQNLKRLFEANGHK